MKNHSKTILFALTAVLLFSSLLQQTTGFCKTKKLSGVTEAVAKPVFSFANCRTGAYQRNTAAYLKQHYGFCEPLTRLYNQTVWALFHYSRVVETRRILINDDNWIFEPWTVEEYYQSRMYSYAKDSAELVGMMEAEARRLYQLQRMLEPNGTHLFVALLPGKELVCSEHLPKNTAYFKEKKITAFEYYSKELKQLGIHHVNFADWFMQIKDTTSYPLFPQTGTHWSNLAAMHVADTLIRYMEHLSGLNMLNLEIGSPFQRTVAPDNDLESLMNLIWPLQKAPNFLADYCYTADSTAVSPQILTIGDSFYWNIINMTRFGTAFRAFPYWYYFSTAYFSGPETKVAKIDLLNQVLSSDFVMLSYSTASLYGMSNGFSQRLLLELCYEPEEIKAKTGQVRTTIKNDSAWMARIHADAKKKGRSNEQELISETNRVIFSNLEHYFPALCDSIPTQRSLKARKLMGDSLVFAKRKIENPQGVIRPLDSGQPKKNLN